MKIASLSLIPLVVLLLMPVTAVEGNTGELRHNPEMTLALEEGRPPEGFRWYATGRETFPDAIIGLDLSWKQTAAFWQEILMSPGEAKKLFQSVRPFRNRPPKAYDILSPDGKVIGIFWSSITYTVIKMGRGNEVKVYPPKPPGNW